MFLIDDLLLLPAKAFLGMVRKIQEMVDREVTDEAYIHERLLEIQLLYEMDEIGDEEYGREAALWEGRLNALRDAAQEARIEAGAPVPDVIMTGERAALRDEPRAA